MVLISLIILPGVISTGRSHAHSHILLRSNPTSKIWKSQYIYILKNILHGCLVRGCSASIHDTRYFTCIQFDSSNKLAR